jgi:hypothetical protein
MTVLDVHAGVGLLVSVAEANKILRREKWVLLNPLQIPPISEGKTIVACGDLRRMSSVCFDPFFISPFKHVTNVLGVDGVSEEDKAPHDIVAKLDVAKKR